MTISPRTAEVALTWIRAGLRRMEPHRNGTPTPPDILAALAELQAASAPTRTEVGPQPVAVQPFEHIDVPTAARRLGISIRAVQKRCAAGTLPAERVGRRSWLIRWEQGWQGSSSTTPGTSGPTSPIASTTG